MRTCVPKVPNVINYIFSTHLQVSNGKQLYLQQQTRPYVSGFPLGCCDHRSLMDWKDSLKVALCGSRHTTLKKMNEWYKTSIVCNFLLMTKNRQILPWT
jgi:hypothetical protein